jgi:hypothetical protein
MFRGIRAISLAFSPAWDAVILTMDASQCGNEKMKEFYRLKRLNNLFYLLKDSIVGGPSIIFNRYHEANKTYIRGLNKLCKKIIGYDANAFYSSGNANRKA